MIEKEVYLDFSKIGFNKVELYKYSLSNDITEIVAATMVRAGVMIDLKDIKFVRNYMLSENVKKLMIENNAEYSMTINLEGYFRDIVINRHTGNDWFIYICPQMILPNTQEY